MITKRGPLADSRPGASSEFAHVAQQSRVGPYRLLNLVRAGKTCEVYEVLNDLTGQRRAIKLLADEAAHNREEVGYLKHEHLVGQKLSHPQVINIYEFGTDKDAVYLAMELFAAPNLKQWINQGVDSFASLATSAIQKAGEGLAYFHAQGWVHRDVKPDNFLMNSEGDVKLIDFALAVRPKRGLARLFSGRPKVQGTRSYMSPEQIRAQPVDQRSDLYSFACMVYELLGGKPPYTGTSTNDLLNKHLRATIPPLQASNRNVSDDFAELIRASLAKNPDERPPSVADFLREMRSMKVFKIPPAAVR